MSKAAKDIHQILSAFLDGIRSEKNLEDYWIKNKTGITTIKTMNAELYADLIEQFKVRRKEIQEGGDDS